MIPSPFQERTGWSTGYFLKKILGFVSSFATVFVISSNKNSSGIVKGCSFRQWHRAEKAASLKQGVCSWVSNTY